ncbi:T9SS type A sorting domain-containing protein [bacterium BMS3Abin03]|nr:T9SS type A sorting domain-containing protein [bacterium BMS3Abin03]
MRRTILYSLKISLLSVFIITFFASIQISAQQINIPRIEQMPNLPSPYEMRDWKQTAIGYDSFVFDFNLTGQYLPLIWLNTNTVNYPNHNSFGLHTVVGTNSTASSEAINLLPAVVGASLCGVDKSNQAGYNWVLMCEEYFNKNNGANVYLNHPDGSNWDDWWYDVMPNIFFYQLYSLYPNTGDFNFQFTSVADKWLAAVKTMGGSTTPWQKPNMDYRAFNLKTMKPYTLDVHEPEAAGAIAWILYNAYIETNDTKYRIGADWAMEFLIELTSNPSYELQLPYGAYLAARMNAELGTTYDIEKLVNWCFNVGPLRDWGSILGHWGSYDVHGLIGEVNGSNDYAFLMNTFEQVGALVPLVRYDERFARAIGKWVLNASNAARLFYTNYLPDQNQDSEEWSHQYDPNSYIGHEAMRETQYAQSPYATGDAVDGNWGMTNLALYGSSHVGILGGIIDTTNVEQILMLDLLKTDYFHKDAYPSYLIYNPYSEDKIVNVNFGNDQHDIYDVVSKTFLKNGVSGPTTITIPSDAAIIAIFLPSGGNITYDLDKMLINGIIVDYHSGQTVLNYPPRIKSLSADSTIILLGSGIKVYCTATDKDNDVLSYAWSVSGGSISGSGSQVNWTAPNSVGTYFITCLVEDGNSGEVNDTINIKVVESINNDPVIEKILANPRKIHLGTQSEITCYANDVDGDQLSFSWSSQEGSFSGSGSQVVWTAPSSEGYYFINCTVDDERGGITSDSLLVSVRDTSVHQSGNLVAFYPFNGNANDESGNGNNGTVYQASLVSDRFNNPNRAYKFDGVNDYIQISNSTILNFSNSITVSFWIKVNEFFDREAYPLSHGNWENRWKVSITNKGIRWTVKTTTGVKDLDSETELKLDSLYNVVVLYDGSDYEIYINGKLNALTTFSGSILSTTIDFMIGQVLPGDNQYNFKGVLDDIRIYDYALSYNEIGKLYDIITSADDKYDNQIPVQTILYQNYPNPFNPKTKIGFRIAEFGFVSLKVYDVLGEEITTIINEEKSAGNYEVEFDANNLPSGIYFCRLKAGSYIQTKKLLLLK